MKKVLFKLLFFLACFIPFFHVSAGEITNDLTGTDSNKINATKINVSKIKSYTPSKYDASTAVINDQINKGVINSGEKAFAPSAQGVTITDNYIVITQGIYTSEEQNFQSTKNAILIINKNDLSVNTTLYEPLWHANDVTYNSNSNEIIFLKRNNADGTTHPYVVLYNSNNLTKKDIIDLSTKSVTGGFAIAYNPTNNKYYYGWNNRINILNDDFSKTNNTGTIITNCKVAQTFNSINNKIYYLTVRNNTTTCSNTDGYATDDTIIYEFDAQGNYLKPYYINTLTNSTASIEFEGMDVDPSTGVIYLIANRYVFVNGTAQLPTTEIGLYKVNSNVKIRMNMNGGDLAETHNSQYTKSGDVVLRNNNQFSHTAAYGNEVDPPSGLIDYNNPNGLNIEKKGYIAKTGEQWKKADGTTYNQYSVYSAVDFCAPSLTDCVVDLYVNWTPVDYTITYDLDEGTAPVNKTSYNIETNSFTLNNPTKPGYTFIGWTGSNGTTPQTVVTIEKGSTGDKSYTANFVPNKVNIRMHMNGGILDDNHGSAVSSSGNYITLNNQTTIHTINYNEALPADGLADYNNPGYINIVKNGYTAAPNAEWKNNNETTYNQSNVYSASDFCDITNNNCTVDLYVNWTPVDYTITYDLDEGTAPVNKTSYNIETNSFTLNNPTKPGYTFIGWTGSNGTTPQTVVTIEKGSTGDKTYTANYEKNAPETYTITYDLNGGTVSSNPETYTSETNSFTLNNPTKPGYTFIGWTGSNGTTPQTTVTIERGSTGNKTYTANYEKNQETVTLTFDSNGGSSVSSITQLPGTEITEPTSPTKSGYTFAGWYEDLEFNNKFAFTVMPNENKTLYAKWTGNTYTITFDTNGGTTLNPIVIEKDEILVEPTNITKTGYSLEGWYTDADFEHKYNFNLPVDSNLTLHVKWAPINYTITYDLDEGTVSGNKTSYNIETNSFTLNNPTKPGYTFIGWTGSNGTTPQTTVTIEKGSTGNKTYTANYEKNDSQTYTITYDLNGGTVSSNPQSYTSETNSFTLNNPTKPGYTFIGWTGSNGTTPQTTVTIEKGSTGDRTYTANYEKNDSQTYTITFDTDGGSSINSITQQAGTEITEPTSPTKAGYTFAGWYEDLEFKNKFAFTIMPNENKTLYAKWTVNTYTITFNTNGGSNINSITALYNSEITKPNDPLKENYKFAGWYEDKEFTKLFTFTTMPSESITLYAKWISNDIYTITYELYGGSNNTNNPTSYKNGETLDLYSPTKKGYKFVGWYLDQQFTKQVLKITSDMKDDLTLYAKWEPDSNMIKVPITSSNIPIAIIIIGIVLIAVSGYFILKKV
ncbi:MAG: InlB B-repeat-containing protein [Bacilli bacterium]|nr:InlB B-repeat-containing protein [Bacilli bacterium]